MHEHASSSPNGRILALLTSFTGCSLILMLAALYHVGLRPWELRHG